MVVDGELPVGLVVDAAVVVVFGTTVFTNDSVILVRPFDMLFAVFNTVAVYDCSISFDIPPTLLNMT